LNVESGGIVFDNSAAGFRFIGSTAAGGVAGILTAGGSAPSGPVELVVGANAGAQTINAVITDNPNGPQPLTFTKTLGGTLTLATNNTYTGLTIVNGGTLNLSNPTSDNSLVFTIPGDLIINDGTVAEPIAGGSPQCSPHS